MLYSGGLNTEHVRILDIWILYKWWMIQYSNAILNWNSPTIWIWNKMMAILLFYVGVMIWNGWDHSYSYGPYHSNKEPFEIGLSNCSDFKCTVGIWNPVIKKLGFKWSGFWLGSEIRKPSHLNLDKFPQFSKTIWNPDKNIWSLNGLVFEWFGFLMVGNIAIAKAGPFD